MTKAKTAKTKSKSPSKPVDKGAKSAEQTAKRVVAPAAVYMRTTSLKPWKDNPRNNDGEPVRRVAASIKRFGFGEPILARTSNNEIIAGHTRWKAALQLKLEQVPVRLLDLSESEAHLLALADNRLGELAEWNVSLSDMLASLQSDDALVAGWSLADIDKLTAELAGTAANIDDEAPRLDRPGATGEHAEHFFLCPKCGYDSKSPAVE